MTEAVLEFEKIHADYRPKLKRYLSRLVGECDAEDLTQEAFVKIDRALKDFRGESSLSTWLYRIATNVALDRLRRQSCHTITVTSLCDDSAENDEAEIQDRDAWTGENKPSVEQQLVHKEMNDCIRGFIDKLPEHYRTVMVLSELEEFKNSEIAEILNVSLDTVKIRLHRARTRLKEQLETHCELDWLEEIPCHII